MLSSSIDKKKVAGPVQQKKSKTGDEEDEMVFLLLRAYEVCSGSIDKTTVDDHRKSINPKTEICKAHQPSLPSLGMDKNLSGSGMMNLPLEIAKSRCKKTDNFSSKFPVSDSLIDQKPLIIGQGQQSTRDSMRSLSAISTQNPLRKSESAFKKRLSNPLISTEPQVESFENEKSSAITKSKTCIHHSTKYKLSNKTQVSCAGEICNRTESNEKQKTCFAKRRPYFSADGLSGTDKSLSSNQLDHPDDSNQQTTILLSKRSLGMCFETPSPFKPTNGDTAITHPTVRRFVNDESMRNDSGSGFNNGKETILNREGPRLSGTDATLTKKRYRSCSAFSQDRSNLKRTRCGDEQQDYRTLLSFRDMSSPRDARFGTHDKQHISECHHFQKPLDICNMSTAESEKKQNHQVSALAKNSTIISDSDMSHRTGTPKRHFTNPAFSRSMLYNELKQNEGPRYSVQKSTSSPPPTLGTAPKKDTFLEANSPSSPTVQNSVAARVLQNRRGSKASHMCSSEAPTTYFVVQGLAEDALETDAPDRSANESPPRKEITSLAGYIDKAEEGNHSIGNFNDPSNKKTCISIPLQDVRPARKEEQPGDDCIIGQEFPKSESLCEQFNKDDSTSSIQHVTVSKVSSSSVESANPVRPAHSEESCTITNLNQVDVSDRNVTNFNFRNATFPSSRTRGTFDQVWGTSTVSLSTGDETSSICVKFRPLSPFTDNDVLSTCSRICFIEEENPEILKGPVILPKDNFSCNKRIMDATEFNSLSKQQHRLVIQKPSVVTVGPWCHEAAFSIVTPQQFHLDGISKVLSKRKFCHDIPKKETAGTMDLSTTALTKLHRFSTKEVGINNIRSPLRCSSAIDKGQDWTSSVKMIAKHDSLNQIASQDEIDNFNHKPELSLSLGKESNLQVSQFSRRNRTVSDAVSAVCSLLPESLVKIINNLNFTSSVGESANPGFASSRMFSSSGIAECQEIIHKGHLHLISNIVGGKNESHDSNPAVKPTQVSRNYLEGHRDRNDLNVDHRIETIEPVLDASSCSSFSVSHARHSSKRKGLAFFGDSFQTPVSSIGLRETELNSGHLDRMSSIACVESAEHSNDFEETLVKEEKGATIPVSTPGFSTFPPLSSDINLDEHMMDTAISSSSCDALTPLIRSAESEFAQQPWSSIETSLSKPALHTWTSPFQSACDEKSQKVRKIELSVIIASGSSSLAHSLSASRPSEVADTLPTNQMFEDTTEDCGTLMIRKSSAPKRKRIHLLEEPGIETESNDENTQNVFKWQNMGLQENRVHQGHDTTSPICLSTWRKPSQASTQNNSHLKTRTLLSHSSKHSLQSLAAFFANRVSSERPIQHISEEKTNNRQVQKQLDVRRSKSRKITTVQNEFLSDGVNPFLSFIPRDLRVFVSESMEGRVQHVNATSTERFHCMPKLLLSNGSPVVLLPEESNMGFRISQSKMVMNEIDQDINQRLRSGPIPTNMETKVDNRAICNWEDMHISHSNQYSAHMQLSDEDPPPVVGIRTCPANGAKETLPLCAELQQTSEAGILHDANMSPLRKEISVGGSVLALSVQQLVSKVENPSAVLRKFRNEESKDSGKVPVLDSIDVQQTTEAEEESCQSGIENPESMQVDALPGHATSPQEYSQSHLPVLMKMPAAEEASIASIESVGFSAEELVHQHSGDVYQTEVSSICCACDESDRKVSLDFPKNEFALERRDKPENVELEFLRIPNLTQIPSDVAMISEDFKISSATDSRDAIKSHADSKDGRYPNHDVDAANLSSFEICALTPQEGNSIWTDIETCVDTDSHSKSGSKSSVKCFDTDIQEIHEETENLPEAEMLLKSDILMRFYAASDDFDNVSKDRTDSQTTKLDKEGVGTPCGINDELLPTSKPLSQPSSSAQLHHDILEPQEINLPSSLESTSHHVQVFVHTNEKYLVDEEANDSGNDSSSSVSESDSASSLQSSHFVARASAETASRRAGQPRRSFDNVRTIGGNEDIFEGSENDDSDYAPSSSISSSSSWTDSDSELDLEDESLLCLLLPYPPELIHDSVFETEEDEFNATARNLSSTRTAAELDARDVEQLLSHMRGDSQGLELRRNELILPGRTRSEVASVNVNRQVTSSAERVEPNCSIQ